MGSDYGPWEPLSIAAVAELFAGSPCRWWISGGHALELHLARSWRAHDDVDAGVVRDELAEVYAVVSALDPHIAAAGVLSRWQGEPLVESLSQNNVWCRRGPDAPWCLDVTIGEGSPEEWIYRRDRSVRRPWGDAVLRSPKGVAYLAPELQLLYKSAAPRPKDDLDAREVIPELDETRRARLANLLSPDHPWQEFLR